MAQGGGIGVVCVVGLGWGWGGTTDDSGLRCVPNKIDVLKFQECQHSDIWHNHVREQDYPIKAIGGLLQAAFEGQDTSL